MPTSMPQSSYYIPPLVCGAILVGAFFYKTPTPAAPTEQTELNPTGPDMLSVFAANPDKAEAKVHAAEFGAICRRAARTLDVDGQRGPDRRLVTGLDLAEYRKDLRVYTTEGWSFAAKYPQLPSVVSAHLDKAAGNDPKEMDDEARKKWAMALNAIAQNSQYAAERIK